jgi:ubiquitin-like 1-activating enzyme E1 B
VKINAIHGNIKEPQYDVDWFKGFDLVMNALDNLGEILFRVTASYNPL